MRVLAYFGYPQAHQHDAEHPVRSALALVEAVPIELYLEETATNPQIAVGTVRKLIQERKVDVVRGGINGITRQAIKDPIVSRGRTLYIYPENYEGTECTKDLFCTGPTPTQQCDELIPI